MWKPIKRLMAKAQYVREMQKAATTKLDRQWQIDHAISSLPDGSLASSTPMLSAGTGNASKAFSGGVNAVTEGGVSQTGDASGLAKQSNLFPTKFPLQENNGLMLNQDGLSSLADYHIEDWINFDNTEEMNSVMRFSSLYDY